MRTIKIGRSKDNDCVFEPESVSRSHAVLTQEKDQRWKLKDLNSKHGTYVNGKRITEMEVRDTDTIKFGSVLTSISGIIEKTNETVVKPGPNIPIGAQSRTIGKNPENQIRLNHDDVSRKHAILYKMPNGDIVIEDCRSKNGTFVNGVKVTSQKLHPGDKVTITRNYPLEWESIFGSTPEPNTLWKKVLKVAAIIVAIVCIGGVGKWIYDEFFRTFTLEEVYAKYNTSVCWVYAEYGYKVYIDGNDHTKELCRICEIEEQELVHFEDGDLKSGPTQAQGTAFFISDDGKLATNLHITRPWLFTRDTEQLEKGMNKIVALASIGNPLLSRSQVKVDGIMTAMYIIPNDLPISNSNAVECSEVNGSNDINKDVAIIQTKSRALPQQVKRVIDLSKADISEKSLKVGKTVYTIGFPYGATIAMNSNQELKNQGHSGVITQNRGDYEFGHDAETASGASGSPIFNDRGRLIGIHHAGLTGVTGAQGFNMGIKAKYIIELLK